MTLEAIGFDADTAIAIPSFSGSDWTDEFSKIELSPGLRADLLDSEAWSDILTTYGRTMRVAVALTDAQGNLLGACYNAQPVWTLIHDAYTDWGHGCPFCITKRLPCTAVAEALHSGKPKVAHDQAGLTHVTIPLLVGKQPLGAIIAGQVLDRFPDPLRLQRVAKEFGIAPQPLWNVATRQRPVSGTVLKASGDLLYALGRAFLQQRYGAILKTRFAETNERFRLLVEGVKDYALFTMDRMGRVTGWNDGARRMLGYCENTIVGQNFSCIFIDEDIQNHVPEKQLRDALRAGRVDDEGWRVREDRHQFWASVNITPMSEDVGRTPGFTIIIQDVSERRKLAIVLEEARLERTRLQEAFLSHVSHELRTPLTAIYFFTTNVLDGLLGELTPKQHDHLELALNNVNQLKDMVNDLLDITRVQTHKLNVEPQHASPARLIAEAVSTCLTNATAKKITLLSEVEPDSPYLWADPSRVRQILINLIDNAIKFTPEGGTVIVKSQPFAENADFLRFSVSDTGCGISPKDVKTVFDRLAQVKSTAEASRSGLGLGLFITRELVLRHGGQIWLESREREGSIFFFTLPVFSLAKLCARIFTLSNFQAGSVTLITVDVVSVKETIQEDILPEIQAVLVRCIHPGQDMLLRSMRDEQPLGTFFIVACTDSNGAKIIGNRIRREFQHVDDAARFKLLISQTTLTVASGEPIQEQIREITTRINQSVDAYLLSKKKPI